MKNIYYLLLLFILHCWQVFFFPYSASPVSEILENVWQSYNHHLGTSTPVPIVKCTWNLCACVCELKFAIKCTPIVPPLSFIFSLLFLSLFFFLRGFGIFFVCFCYLNIFLPVFLKRKMATGAWLIPVCDFACVSYIVVVRLEKKKENFALFFLVCFFNYFEQVGLQKINIQSIGEHKVKRFFFYIIYVLRVRFGVFVVALYSNL